MSELAYTQRAGGYITFLNEVQNSGWLASTSRHPLLPFGTTEHLRLFKSAAWKVNELIGGENTILLKFNWADRTAEATPVNQVRGRTANEWNFLFAKYYELASEAGIQVLEVPSDLSVSTQDHAWGPAQYHFIDDFYNWIADELRPRQITK